MPELYLATYEVTEREKWWSSCYKTLTFWFKSLSHPFCTAKNYYVQYWVKWNQSLLSLIWRQRYWGWNDLFIYLFILKKHFWDSLSSYENTLVTWMKKENKPSEMLVFEITKVLPFFPSFFLFNNKHTQTKKQNKTKKLPDCFCFYFYFFNYFYK